MNKSSKHSSQLSCTVAQRGATLVEVLVSIVIMTFGLLGLAGLQNRAHTAELESYQREQALFLMDDMAARVASNKANSSLYVTASGVALGTSVSDAADCSTLSQRWQIDQCDWSKMLKGASETRGSTKLGAMIDARGCILKPAASVDEYLVVVVWQGLNPTVAPANLCGNGLYDSAETRRAVTTTVRVANLSAP